MLPAVVELDRSHTWERTFCRLGLLGLAGDARCCIRSLGKTGPRRDEDDCSAALWSNCSGSREKIHHTHSHRFQVPVSLCGTILVFDNLADNLVAHYADVTDSTGPAGGSVLYQAIGLDFGDHCESVVLPPLVFLVIVAWAATFYPRFGLDLRTAHCLQHTSFLDLASPHRIHRIHPVAQCYFDIPAEVHFESY